jgi:hypothetical protein
LGRREDQNILELEIDEIMDESGPGEISDLPLNFLPGILNFLSPRSAPFTVPAVGKGSDNPFFRLLDFSDKNAKVPQGNS